MGHPLEQIVVRHTHRVPLPAPATTASDAACAPAPDARDEGAAAVRQFDIALMSVGFKLSGPLLERLHRLPAAEVTALADRTLGTVRELTGDHVRHNAYFRDFPHGVPDTLAFWAECAARALTDPDTRGGVLGRFRDRLRGRTAAPVLGGTLDLLSLPGYGTYQHTYAELLAAHEELIAGAGDRTTVLHPGGTPEEESTALYLALAGSVTPLGEEGLRDLAVLAGHHAHGPRPEALPVRENRAVVNRARLTAGADLLLDTVTDVLRLACALSDGDVSLATPTRFRAPSRPVRRALLAGLDAVVAADPARLAEVTAHRERFKRLGERLHPHEYPRFPHAADVFAVARGELPARTLDSRTEELFAAGDAPGAARLLAAAAPGKLLRDLDRLLRAAPDPAAAEAVVAAATGCLPRVSGRVLLSVRDHLHGRAVTGPVPGAVAPVDPTPENPAPDSSPSPTPLPPARRVFVNGRGRAWVTADTRPPLRATDRRTLTEAIDTELRGRLPDPGHLVLDAEALDLGLPLSGKATAAGLGVLPRGSRSPVDGELLRFFVYWRQRRRDTDYDLSALVLDASYETVSWLSYTELKALGGVHSGDVTEAPQGASEFIDLRLEAVPGTVIVPQVNIYSGEGFDETEESFFGYMTRDTEQRGRPFEARTVRTKSELRGPGRVALPLAFLRGEDGRWHAHWLHLYLQGSPHANRVEENRVTVSALVRSLVERDHLTVRHLAGLLADRARTVTVRAPGDTTPLPEVPVTYIGPARPEGLHPDSRIVTPENLRDLIPG
ncbi:TerD family protein [Streptomyces sp. NPDC097619]|uniref:TerD family protein n=1 Tax=Streptomyces sp. NPDC097619 TaxID=3157228 RepID=UPI00331BB2BA